MFLRGEPFFPKIKGSTLTKLHHSFLADYPKNSKSYVFLYRRKSLSNGTSKAIVEERCSDMRTFLGILEIPPARLLLSDKEWTIKAP